MLIALLILLGVNLVVVVALLVFVLGRRRWLRRQPGAFAGAIRVSHGDIEGLGTKWKRGSCRWVSDVLVWTKAPLMLRIELVPVDNLAGEYHAAQGEVSRLGDNPAVLEFAVNGARIEVAVRNEDRRLAAGPLSVQVRGTLRSSSPA